MQKQRFVSKRVLIAFAAVSALLGIAERASATLVTSANLGSGDHYIYAFTTDVNTTTSSGMWTVPAGVTSIDLLVIGGGGAGGRSDNNFGGGGGGGGGAGGVLYHVDFPVVPLSLVNITVGGGGIAGIAPTSGGNSLFSSLTALGGGRGAGDGVGASSGGSGGGGFRSTAVIGGSAGSGGLQPTSTSGGYGNSGATRSSGVAAGGGSGGGGAGSAGIAGVASGNGGNGGTGFTTPSQFLGSGILTAYAGGGGGGGDQTTPGFGFAGGGNGVSNTVGFTATMSSGGGGGGGGVLGGGGSNQRNGGSGGSGIVLVAFDFNVTDTSPALHLATENFDSAASATANGWTTADTDGANTDGGPDLVGEWSNTEIANSELAGNQSGEGHLRGGRSNVNLPTTKSTYYADTNFESSYTFASHFAASGRLDFSAISVGDYVGNTLGIAYFDKDSTYSAAGSRNANYVSAGFSLDQSTGGLRLQIFKTDAAGNATFLQSSVALVATPNDDLSFGFSYDPAGGEFGLGRLSGMITNVDTLATTYFWIDLTAANRAALLGSSMDSFGGIKAIAGTGGPTPAGSADLYFDSLTYSVAFIPEPSTMLLGGVGGLLLWGWRRRRR